ncbi:competence protein ComFC [Scopulibacillus darangshiensis]|uniref:Competence protein ComFC n=1 Tax=Scopulibacillus darangshiensis TaxID=442528 RepID=A0A4R2NWP8_9BACL|nr:ComF family protein [Scopulibacillus darangshiensis]TCP26024.1 competence protein ComFC [Scopulibacillus darangshiensis]
MPYCLWCREAYSPAASWGTLFSVSLEERFCQICEERFQAIEGEALCMICGRDLRLLDERYVENRMCSDCVRWEKDGWKDVLQKNRSPFLYNEFMKEVMTAFKFRSDAILAQGFKETLQQYYRIHFPDSVIVPIPLSHERLNDRGFNQSEHLACLLEKPIQPVLVRRLHEEKQSKKSRKERVMPRSNPFEVKADEEIKERLEGQSVLLIDDIYTTGATLRLASKALQPLKPKSVSALTLARGW